VPYPLEVILFALLSALGLATLHYQLRKTAKKFSPVIAHCLVRPILTAYYRYGVSKPGQSKSN
jgi:hypothetical protein